MTDNPDQTLTDGSPVTPDHKELKPNGQQKGYVVLSKEERDKGFVRPVRTTYIHVGSRPRHPTRPLTDDEKARHVGCNYELYEEYPESESPIAGKFWTAQHLRARCGAATTMSQTIAETYARDPKFYGGTFCCVCRDHFPVGEFKWANDNQVVGS